VFQITVNTPVVPAPVLDVDCTEIANLYEYAFAANPTPDAPPILIASRDPGTDNVYIAYRHRFNDPKLVYSVLVSSDFLQWTSADSSLELMRRIPLSDAFENVVFLVPNPIAAHFFRIQISCGH